QENNENGVEWHVTRIGIFHSFAPWVVTAIPRLALKSPRTSYFSRLCRLEMSKHRDDAARNEQRQEQDCLLGIEKRDDAAQQHEHPAERKLALEREDPSCNSGDQADKHQQACRRHAL